MARWCQFLSGRKARSAERPVGESQVFEWNESWPDDSLLVASHRPGRFSQQKAAFFLLGSRPGRIELRPRPDKSVLRTWPEKYTYVGSYPEDRQTRWSDELNGVTHDENHWYFTQKKYLMKFALDRVSSSRSWIRRVRVPQALERLDFGGFGDLDYFEGHLYVATKPGSGDVPRIALFRAKDLELVGSAPLEQLNNVSWCAVNPRDGYLYASHEIDGEAGKFVHVYERVVGEGTFEVVHKGFLNLRDGEGRPMQIRHLQGGDFSENGHLYLSSGYINKHFPHEGINAFDLRTGRLVAHLDVEPGYRPKCPSAKPWTWGNPCEEVQGLTLWDLDDRQAGRLRGQVHLILLDNDATDDDFYLKHYRVDDRNKL